MNIPIRNISWFSPWIKTRHNFALYILSINLNKSFSQYQILFYIHFLCIIHIIYIHVGVYQACLLSCHMIMLHEYLNIKIYLFRQYLKTQIVVHTHVSSKHYLHDKSGVVALGFFWNKGTKTAVIVSKLEIVKMQSLFVYTNWSSGMQHDKHHQ